MGRGEGMGLSSGEGGAASGAGAGLRRSAPEWWAGWGPIQPPFGRSAHCELAPSSAGGGSPWARMASHPGSAARAGGPLEAVLTSQQLSIRHCAPVNMDVTPASAVEHTGYGAVRH